jgi:hypothetical protein
MGDTAQLRVDFHRDIGAVLIKTTVVLDFVGLKALGDNGLSQIHCYSMTEKRQVMIA